LITYSEEIKLYSISIINEDGSEILFLICLDKLTVNEHMIDPKKRNKRLTPAKLSQKEKVDLINKVRNLLAEFKNNPPTTDTESISAKTKQEMKKFLRGHSIRTSIIKQAYEGSLMVDRVAGIYKKTDRYLIDHIHRGIKKSYVLFPDINTAKKQSKDMELKKKR
jgi:hypothetical protein